jgi:hypothetical protein
MNQSIARFKISLLTDLAIRTPKRKFHDLPSMGGMPYPFAPDVERNPQEEYEAPHGSHLTVCVCVAILGHPRIGVEAKQKTNTRLVCDLCDGYLSSNGSVAVDRVDEGDICAGDQGHAHCIVSVQ